ncbi:RmlC-like jelly roll fold [Phaffia rhodozyma]|uniref:RmlC-like jelly roll fold n=1 Tax=Phaffia rhodozyma TaxID=264483 RepID=A0A0F7SE96_PHARH|nr:RmlC-like jelly roll fold [Phaffia rhodozyma]
MGHVTFLTLLAHSSHYTCITDYLLGIVIAVHHNSMNMATVLCKSAPIASTAVNKNPALRLTMRPSEQRGIANHGWLKTFHTFNFASYYDPDFGSFGPLRVINEDRVEANQGFGTHPHQEFEIFSYIVKGELEHRDSIGNVEIMKRGDLQMTSAGTGVRHSEYNKNTYKQVHFLQIWALPNERRLKPAYYTRNVTDEEKKQGLVKVVAPFGSTEVSSQREASGPAPVHADLHLYATVLPPRHVVTHKFQPSLQRDPDQKVSSARKAYVHVVQTSGFNTGSSFSAGTRIRVNDDLELGEGDGAFVVGGLPGQTMDFENIGEKDAEFIVFDLGD